MPRRFASESSARSRGCAPFEYFRVPAFAWPFDERIDLSGPARYDEAFFIPAGGRNQRREMEFRISSEDGSNCLFVRMRVEGPAAELSSGIRCGMTCGESGHGVYSGNQIVGPLILRCGLRYDGQCFKLDVRVQSEGGDGETLIFGSSSFQGAGLGEEAIVTLVEGVGAPAALPGGNGSPRAAETGVDAETGGDSLPEVEEEVEERIRAGVEPRFSIEPWPGGNGAGGRLAGAGRPGGLRRG